MTENGGGEDSPLQTTWFLWPGQHDVICYFLTELILAFLSFIPTLPRLRPYVIGSVCETQRYLGMV